MLACNCVSNVFSSKKQQDKQQYKQPHLLYTNSTITLREFCASCVTDYDITLNSIVSAEISRAAKFVLLNGNLGSVMQCVGV